MTKFEQMIDCARAQNGVFSSDGSRANSFWDDIERCRPFVFHMNEAEGYVVHPDDVSPEISAPFPIFSIEVHEGTVIRAHDGTTDQYFIFCVVVKETEPGRYLFYVYGLDHKGYSVRAIDGGPNSGAVILYTSVSRYLGRLAVGEMGAENVRRAIKIGSRENRRVHRISQLIHVTPKGQSHIAGFTGRKINFSHRFECRGHWRRIDGVGKDRRGEYVVQGHTWVVNHIRGDKDLPLIKKTRIIAPGGTQHEPTIDF